MATENGLRVFRKPFWVEGVRHKKSKGLVLAALIFIGAIGFGEGFAAEPGQVRVESNASSLDCGKGCDKAGANVLRPIAGRRIDAGQSGKDGRSEGSASGSTARAVLAPERKTMVSKNTEQPTNESHKGNDDWSLYLTLPLWLWFYWIAFFPPKTTMEHNG